jgi:hypothetical protein
MFENSQIPHQNHFQRTTNIRALIAQFDDMFL